VALNQGALSDGALPPLLRELYVGRKTGYLYFSRPGHNCSVLFRGGHIVHASTDLSEDWLGEVLVLHGFITREQFQQAAAHAERDKKRLGQVLRDQGTLPAERVEEGMALQVRQILYRVFSWTDGSYRFEPLVSIQTKEAALKLSTGDMILEAVHRVRDPEVIRRGIGDADLPLGLSADPLLRFQNLTLAPADIQVFACVDGTLSARQVAQAVPIDDDDALRSLFGLLCTGVIEQLPARPRGRAAAPAAPPPLPSAAPARVSAPGSAAAAVPEAPAAHAATAADEAREMEERRREIVELFDGLRSKTHYEMLGVARNAPDADVKEAYFKRARRFHPDVHHQAVLADLAPKLEAVFIRLGEAYEVLRHKHSRASYDRTLPFASGPVAGSATTGPPEPSPAPAPAPAPEPGMDPKTAAENVRRGEKHLAEARYWDAIQMFEPALDHVEGPLKQRALLGLGRALLRNPNWVKRAEEVLQELLRLAPKHVEGLMELALLYHSSGLKSRALAMFRRVLEVEPENEQALLRVAELEPPPPPEPGMLKKLFGRK
jgi:tetratricopeptide (TPR) repeat protein